MLLLSSRLSARCLFQSCFNDIPIETKLRAGWYTFTEWNIVVNLTQDSSAMHTAPGVYQTGLYLRIMHNDSHFWNSTENTHYDFKRYWNSHSRKRKCDYQSTEGETSWLALIILGLTALCDVCSGLKVSYVNGTEIRILRLHRHLAANIWMQTHKLRHFQWLFSVLSRWGENN